MSETIRALARLDAEIFAISRRLVPFKARREGLAKTLAERQKDVAAAETKLTALRKECHEDEVEVKTLEERLARENKKLDAVQSVKAAQAVEHEIGLIKARLSEMEDETLARMEECDGAERALAAARQSLAAIETELAQLDRDLARGEEEVRAATAARQAERETLIAALPPDLRKSYIGLSVTRKLADPIRIVEGDSCGGCQAELKPNMRVHLHAGQVVVCDRCHRLLIAAEAPADLVRRP